MGILLDTMKEISTKLKELGWDENLIEHFMNKTFEPAITTNQLEIFQQYYETNNIVLESADNNIVINANI